MAKARFKVAPGHKFYDNWTMQEEGAEVVYEGDPGENLIPLNAEAKAAWKRRHNADYKAEKVPEPVADEEG